MNNQPPIILTPPHVKRNSFRPNPVNPMGTKRFGSFEIKDHLLEADDPIVRRIMSQCIIMRAEHILYFRAVAYLAASHLFDVLEEDQYPPEYEWIFDAKEDTLTTRLL